MLILGSSLRSRDGCEAPSKHRHQDKINIMESSGGYLCEQPSLNCEIISALRICRASLKAVDLEKCQHGLEILNLYSENFYRNITMAMLIGFFVCYSYVFDISWGEPRCDDTIVSNSFGMLEVTASYQG